MIINNYYELEYDSIKNRVYYKMKGLWESVAVVPNFEQDWRNIVKKTRDDWTILGDLRTLQPMPDDVTALNGSVQQYLMTKGLRKVAQVAKVAVAGSINAMARKSGLKEVLWAFYDNPTAEIWLNK